MRPTPIVRFGKISYFTFAVSFLFQGASLAGAAGLLKRAYPYSPPVVEIGSPHASAPKASQAAPGWGGLMGGADSSGVLAQIPPRFPGSWKMSNQTRGRSKPWVKIGGFLLPNLKISTEGENF
jgi:hypothetical protein